MKTLLARIWAPEAYRRSGPAGRPMMVAHGRSDPAAAWRKFRRQTGRTDIPRTARGRQRLHTKVSLQVTGSDSSRSSAPALRGHPSCDLLALRLDRPGTHRPRWPRPLCLPSALRCVTPAGCAASRPALPSPATPLAAACSVTSGPASSRGWPGCGFPEGRDGDIAFGLALYRAIAAANRPGGSRWQCRRP